MKHKKPRQEWDPKRNLLETELGNGLARDDPGADLGNGWMVIEHFEMQGGRRVVARLTLCPAPRPAVIGPVRGRRRKDGEVAPGATREGRRKGDPPEDADVPPGGITARLLRTIKVGQHAEPVVADYRRWLKKNFGASALQHLDAHTGRPSRRRKRKEPKTRRATDRFYAEIARDYALLCREGSKAPTRDLARIRLVPVEKMRSYVHLARRSGFLTDTSRGKVGGELTGKARKELSLDSGDPADTVQGNERARTAASKPTRKEKRQ